MENAFYFNHFINRFYLFINIIRKDEVLHFLLSYFNSGNIEKSLFMGLANGLDPLSIFMIVGAGDPRLEKKIDTQSKSD